MVPRLIRALTSGLLGLVFLGLCLGLGLRVTLADGPDTVVWLDPERKEYLSHRCLAEAAARGRHLPETATIREAAAEGYRASGECVARDGFTSGNSPLLLYLIRRYGGVI